jgi:flagellin
MPGTYYVHDLGVEIKEGKPVMNSNDVTRQLFGEFYEIEDNRDTDGKGTIKITGSNGAELTVDAEVFIEDIDVGKDAMIKITRPPKEDYATQLDLDLTGLGSMRLQVGTEEGEVIEASIPSMTTESLGIIALDLTTEDSATKSIDRVKNAIEYVNSARARMGAYENRLENTETFIDAYNEEVTGSYSRLMDTDMSETMIDFTNYQILSQAGMSMLAQANEAPQKALQLLQ